MARSRRLREIVLNLLPILRSLLETNSVSRTAAALSLTPSAVSHALARLRRTLEDELFVRTAAGLTPTPCATRLADDLGVGLATIERAVGGVAFEPRTANHLPTAGVTAATISRAQRALERVGHLA